MRPNFEMSHSRDRSDTGRHPEGKNVNSRWELECSGKLTNSKRFSSALEDGKLDQW